MLNLINFFKFPPFSHTRNSHQVPADLSIMLIRNCAKKLEHFNDGDLETSIERVQGEMDSLAEQRGNLNYEKVMAGLRRMDNYLDDLNENLKQE